MDKTLGLNYKLKRMSLGLSQEQLCELIHINHGYLIMPQQISELENGKRFPAPVLVDYLNRTLTLGWNDMIDSYLKLINDPRDLLDLLELLLQEGNHFSNRVMRKIVRTMNTSRTQKNIQILILAWFYFIAWKPRYHRSRVLEMIKTLMNKVPKKTQISILEEVYSYLNDHSNLHKFIWLMKSMMEVILPFKINHLRILDLNVTALFREKKYLEVVMLSEKMKDLLQNQNCPEAYTQSFNYRFALSYLYLGYYSESRKRLREVRDKSKADRELSRDCHYAIAFSYFKEANVPLAKNHWNEALSLCLDTDSKKIRILAYYCYIEILDSNGTKAKQLFHETERCISQSNQHEDEIMIDMALHMRNQALLKIHEREYRSAIELLMKSIEILKGTPFEDEVMNSWLAILYSLGRNAIDSSNSLIKETELNYIMSLK